MAKLDKPSCPKCGSKQVLYRKKTKTSWCRICGHEFKRTEKKQ